jgi:hypothetical protein
VIVVVVVLLAAGLFGVGYCAHAGYVALAVLCSFLSTVFLATWYGREIRRDTKQRLAPFGDVVEYGRRQRSKVL